MVLSEFKRETELKAVVWANLVHCSTFKDILLSVWLLARVHNRKQPYFQEAFSVFVNVVEINTQLKLVPQTKE